MYQALDDTTGQLHDNPFDSCKCMILTYYVCIHVHLCTECCLYAHVYLLADEFSQDFDELDIGVRDTGEN